jgi:two-component system, OmpR family, phosphate regulon sensor histidine kinase PhoR
MKKTLRFLLFMAALTVSGILLFQCYWVFNTYKTAEQNLNNLLTSILQRSINNYQVQQIKLPVSLNDKSPHLDVMEWKTTAPGNDGRNGALLKFNEVSVDTNDISRVKLMIAQLLLAKENKPVRLDLLSQLFTQELRKSNLVLSFKFRLQPYQQKLPENKIAGFINFSGSGPIVVAEMKDLNSILIKKNLLPALISFTLILFSAGSLFYMWIIIRRQIKLDSIKNDFISNIAHEFRTPLSILKSTHEILIDFGEMNDPDKTRKYLLTNREIIQRMETNTERILDITHFESDARPANVAAVHINNLIEDIIVRFKIRDEVQIHFIKDDGLTEVNTDAYIVDTIISNLIDNAIKYAGVGVDVKIQLAGLQNSWKIIVEDNGKGIAPEHLPFIFDKYYRVTSGDLHEVKGYGLGLSYVRQLVNSLNGKIEVRSKINAGTTFIIKLPIG